MPPMPKDKNLSFSIFCKTGLLSIFLKKILFCHSRANFSKKTLFYHFYFTPPNVVLCDNEIKGLNRHRLLEGWGRLVQGIAKRFNPPSRP